MPSMDATWTQSREDRRALVGVHIICQLVLCRRSVYGGGHSNIEAGFDVCSF